MSTIKISSTLIGSNNNLYSVNNLNLDLIQFNQLHNTNYSLNDIIFMNLNYSKGEEGFVEYSSSQNIIFNLDSQVKYYYMIVDPYDEELNFDNEVCVVDGNFLKVGSINWFQEYEEHLINTLIEEFPHLYTSSEQDWNNEDFELLSNRVKELFNVKLIRIFGINMSK